MNTKIMKEFPRTNIALAIFVNIISGGLYSVYWIQRKSVFLSSKSPQDKLPIFRNSHLWFGGVWLFVFGFLYLIYKIDQFPSNKFTPDNPEAHPA